MKIGTEVKATKRLTEENFMGAALHVHAERGEVGIVEDVDPIWITVRFRRSGTAVGCSKDEIRAVRKAPQAA